MRNGMTFIAEERLRRIESGKWTPEGDDQLDNEVLALMGAAYALSYYPSKDLYHMVMKEIAKHVGDTKWFEDDDYIRNLAKAGAFMAAEIDRVIRYDTSVFKNGPFID